MFRTNIVRDIMQPHFLTDIQSFLQAKKNWRCTGMTFETCSKLLLGFGSVISFAAGSFNNQNLSFVAGTVSTVSLVALQFAQFSYREMKKSNEDLTALLKSLKIDPTVDLEDEIDILSPPPPSPSLEQSPSPPTATPPASTSL